MTNQENLKNDIKNFLFEKNCEKTYFHCIMVGECAYKLGKNYLSEPNKARVAGYLHDISAIYPNEERIAIANEYSIELNDAERKFPMIIHQKISKQIAIQNFGILDKEILSAIECHTTLKKNYSELDLVVFVADKIKWDQSGVPPYLNGLLKELDESLENAAYYYIEYILKNGVKVVHPWLWEAYIKLKNKLS
ncbi:bis(5'-nucleosyl)-tetraphosphatase (symmetrical) YqeK [Enterococcus durans]|uniref:bis(5'-nucleosyl)-tetraphosphatase (symmetrical) YqeK n=1 Tax=Enterococcus durans TaxID=53345 RepID=UPI001880BCBA|nr:bis(5'-nucleosyl)-tetraphosphatase (symmetrical) YqeK [Enterococcus durans]MBE8848229.1 HD domain-containing protein [Enterococcus durans]MDB1653800.1 bis(5'-nucleosyl)-tetraphosphatase (symmetrical) YqeK [Enterococcus durans]MDB1654845.1 bis(5'-nucleosyl)-tetraphosphatase (symmetrical) YqeK [Enterococcus durans]MDB1663916.1 bis(5'-nucleosyl)-tetraphosphatase (symmetrical) YqeK [Enterococcus durans]MDB1669512.1 bis(5'-nucleosyl)-tetraphosphatase (symmetrical) YqeK [Enterococcus durans]